MKVEKSFVKALTKVGMTWVQQLPNREPPYKVSGFSVKGLREAMTASGFKSQGKKLFPDSEKCYYVMDAKAKVYAVFQPIPDSPKSSKMYFLEFSGY